MHNINKDIGLRLKNRRELRNINAEKAAKFFRLKIDDFNSMELGNKIVPAWLIEKAAFLYSTPVKNFFDEEAMLFPDDTCDYETIELYRLIRKIDKKFKEHLIQQIYLNQ